MYAIRSYYEEDVSNLYTRRVFIDEIFPERDIVQGQSTVITSYSIHYTKLYDIKYRVDSVPV